MTGDETLTAFLAGAVQALLDIRVERGYPREVRGPYDAGGGTWMIEVQGGTSTCTITLAPGPMPATDQSAASTDSS